MRAQRVTPTIATDAAKMIMDMAAKAGGGYRFQYSPESFTGTELPVALEICNAVIDIVKPTPDNKLIINLPCYLSNSSSIHHIRPISTCIHIGLPDRMIH